MREGHLLAGAALAAVLAPFAASAQQTQPVNAIEDIVVTANRREEAIQSVPVAITAIDGNALREQNISSASDLLGRVPSLSVQPNGTQRDAEGVTIRGQGQTYLAPVGVVNYFAEVPLIQGSIIANQGGPGAFFDLQSLQVLRGPQGTLFGKNTTGGALLLGPHKPTDRLEGYMQGQFGNYDDRELEAVINVPIVSDRLMMRFAVKKVDRDGYTKDVGTGDATLSLPFQGAFFGPRIIPDSGLVLPGTGPNTGIFGLPGIADARHDFRGKDYDDRHYWTARVGMLWRPADGIENYLVSYYTKAHNNGTGQVLTSIDSAHPNLINLVANAYGGLGTFDALDPTIAQAVLDRQKALGPRRVSLNNDQFYRLKTWSVIDTFSAELSDALTFRNIFGYQRMRQSFAWDLDGSYLPVLAQVQNFITPQAISSLPDIANLGRIGARADITNTQLISEEPQLQGKLLDDRLNFVVGAFYSKQTPKGLQSTGSYNAANFGGGFFRITTRSQAVYGQATLDLGALSPALDNLKLTAGVRHTWDKFHGHVLNPSFVVLPVSDASDSTEAMTWTLGLDYQASRNILVFGKVTRGYKAGGFNYAAVQPAGQIFKPERVTSYEIGAKTDFRVGTMPVRFNLSAYSLDYQGIQRANGDNVANGCTDVVVTNPRCALTGNTTGLDQGAITYNAGTARVRGIELETIVRPLKGLELAGSYSYTDAKYKKYYLMMAPDPVSGPQVGVKQTCDGPVAIPQGAGAPGVLINLSCSPFPFTPKNQFSLSARYSFDLGSDIGSVVLGGVYSHSGRAWTAPASLPSQLPSGYVDAYDVVNISIDWNGILGTPLDAHFFVTNLTDTTYRISNSNGDDQSLGYSTSIYNEPRMYGLALRYRFGER